MVGHSLGSIVAFKTGDILSEYFYLVGMNPVLPVDYGAFSFVGIFGGAVLCPACYVVTSLEDLTS